MNVVAELRTFSVSKKSRNKVSNPLNSVLPSTTRCRLSRIMRRTKSVAFSLDNLHNHMKTNTVQEQRRCHLLYVTKEKTEHPKTASKPRVLSFWMDAHRSYCLNCAANSFIKKWEVAFRLSADSGSIGTRIWKFCYALKKKLIGMFMNTSI